MKILAADLGTTLGWAHSNGASGIWDLSVRPDESGGMRLIRLRGKINEIYRGDGIDLLVFEAARNLKHGNAVRVMAQLQGVIEIWCTDHDVNYRGYSPSEIKKYATGSGRANKDDMIVAAKDKWPDIEILSSDHADALWLLDLAIHEYVQPTP